MGHQLEAACASHIGRRRGNHEDNYLFDMSCLPLDNHGIEDTLYLAQPIKRGLCLSVFDGMGGENYGEYASFAAANRLKEILKMPQRFHFSQAKHLLEITKALNQAVVDQARELKTSRMGTTMASLYFTRNHVYACNVGDSRIYRLRNGTLSQLSQDHVSKRILPNHRKPGLTQHLGMDPSLIAIEPYIIREGLQAGDCFLLCSDGLTDMVDDAVLAEVLLRQDDVRSGVQELLQLALENGGRDNTTIILCRIR